MTAHDTGSAEDITAALAASAEAEDRESARARRRMDTTDRRDGYPATRVLAGGETVSDRLISARLGGDTVRLDIINPATAEIKTWAVSFAHFCAIAAGIAADAGLVEQPGTRPHLTLLAKAAAA